MPKIRLAAENFIRRNILSDKVFQIQFCIDSHTHIVLYAQLNKTGTLPDIKWKKNYSSAIQNGYYVARDHHHNICHQEQNGLKISINSTGPSKHLPTFQYPPVRHPLLPLQNGTSPVFRAPIPGSVAEQIVPEHSTVLQRCYRGLGASENCATSALHFA